MRDRPANPEHIADIIARLARVHKGLSNTTLGVKGANVTVPRSVLEHHTSVVDTVLRELRGADGEAPARQVAARDMHAVLLKAWDDQIGGWRCTKCGAVVKDRKDVHVDHIVPLARGGSNDRDNLAAKCATCNLKKGSSEAAA